MNIKVLEELRYINENYEFSKSATTELKDYVKDKGLVDYYDGVLMLTNVGELEIGYTKEQIGMEDEDTQDITEAFFYIDDEDKYF